MGGIVIDQSLPFYVQHEGSTAVIFNVAETDDTRDAVVRLIDLFNESGPIVVVLDYRTASVWCIPKERLR